MDVAENNIKIAKNTMYMYLRMGVSMLVSLYTSRIILLNLGVSDFGIYNVVGSFIAAFTFISGPLSGATQRFFNYELGKKSFGKVNNIFNISFLIYFSLSLLLFIVIEIAGVWFVENKMSFPDERKDVTLHVLHISLIAFAIGLIKIPFDSIIIANEKMSFYAWMSIADVILRLANAYSLSISHFDKLELYTINILLITIIGIICVALYSFKKFKYLHFERINGIVDRKIFVSLLSFSGWSLLGSVSTMTATQGLNVLLNMFFGVVVNAAMGIANQINNAIYQLVNNFQVAFQPQIVKYYASEHILELKGLIYRSAKLSYMLLFCLLCPIWFNVDFLLGVWLGFSNIPDYAAVFCVLMTIYTLMESVQAPLFMAVQATGIIKKYQVIISSAIFLNLLLSYVFLKFGVDPPFVLYIKCSVDIVCLIIRLLFVRSLIGLSVRLFINRVILPIMEISIFPIIVMLFISNMIEQSAIRLIVSCVVFLIIYLPSMFYWGFSKSEREFIVSLVVNKIAR